MSALTPSVHTEPIADVGAWLAVVAGTLGALMATLDVSIINSSLPTIRGEIGASGTEGTWIATAYIVAEIIVIPLSGWLERLLGLRTLLLIASTIFTLCSIVCGLSSTLTVMILGRIGQGFTGGALIPTAMTIVATRLPRSKQPIGNSLFGATALLGPIAGPVLGGWLTDNVSWHYAFFLNLPIGIVLITLLLIAIPHQPTQLVRIREADWLGILGLTLGLGALTVVLEEGEREQWFSSSLIVVLVIVSVLGFFLLGLGQFVSRRPVINLRLLLDRQFGSVVAMVVVIGMVIYGTSYIIPQFLSSISGYNSLQAGKVVMLSGLPVIALMPLAPWLLRNLDIRIGVCFGLSVLALSAWLETDLTSLSDSTAFVDSQILRGTGTIFCMMFLNQAAIRSVSSHHAGDASGLYNAARNLGGSFALAGTAIVQDQRLWVHSRRLEDSLNANSILVQDFVSGTGDGAPRSIDAMIQTQALTMTYADMFWIMSVGIMLAIPLVLFLRPLPHDAPLATGH